MASTPIVAPFPVFLDREGMPIESGYIYIGVQNSDPVNNPIPVFWDEAMTIPAPLPIRTLNGYPSRSGTPSNVFTASAYSIMVKDKNNVLVYSNPSTTDVRADLSGADGASFIGYMAPFFGSILMTQEEVNHGLPVTPEMFGAAGDGIEDDSIPIRDAFATGKSIWFAPGATYIINEQMDITASRFKIYGNGATIKAKDGMTVGSGTRMLYLVDCTDFVIENLILDANRDNRTPAETTAHTLQLQNCKRWKLDTVKCINGVTDGIYLGPGDKADIATYCEDGTVLNCVSDNNYRQGMSIINAYRIAVVGGTYRNTTGHSPSAGIDIEADTGTATISNYGISLLGVDMSGNDGFGLSTSSKGAPFGISMHGCTISNNGLAIANSGGVSVGCDMTIQACAFSDMDTAGNKAILAQTPTNVALDIIGCTFKDIISPASAVIDDGGTTRLLRITDCRFDTTCEAITASSKDAVIEANYFKACSAIAIQAAGSRSRVVDNTVVGAVGRGIFVDGTYALIEGNTVRDITAVVGGYIQSSGLGAIIRNNHCESTAPDVTTPAMQVISTAYLVEGNVAVNLHSTEPYVMSGGFAGLIFRNNVGGTANSILRSRSPIAGPNYTTAGRPAASTTPYGMIFDTTLNKPTWSDGTNWRDAAGTIV